MGFVFWPILKKFNNKIIIIIYSNISFLSPPPTEEPGFYVPFYAPMIVVLSQLCIKNRWKIVEKGHAYRRLTREKHMLPSLKGEGTNEKYSKKVKDYPPKEGALIQF